jgi:quercetin dioxygenase-like cupin family protein
VADFREAGLATDPSPIATDGLHPDERADGGGAACEGVERIGRAVCREDRIIGRMMTRRDAVASLALFADVVASASASAQTRGAAPAPQAGTSPLFVHDLPDLTMDGWEVTVTYVDFPPGSVGTPHRHPGFVLAYVLEGTLINKVSGQAEEQRYSAGQMFYEQPGSTHEVSRNASATQPARLLAMVFAKKGEPLVIPAGRGNA